MVEWQVFNLSLLKDWHYYMSVLTDANVKERHSARKTNSAFALIPGGFFPHLICPHYVWCFSNLWSSWLSFSCVVCLFKIWIRYLISYIIQEYIQSLSLKTIIFYTLFTKSCIYLLIFYQNYHRNMREFLNTYSLVHFRVNIVTWIVTYICVSHFLKFLCHIEVLIDL